MCGRFANRENAGSLADFVGITSGEPALRELLADGRCNIAPSQQILAVRMNDPRQGASLKWGLVPFWADDPEIGNRQINARAETVFEKPAFRAAAKHRRCVIPASGFYEWRRTGGQKRPYYFHRLDGNSMLFARLWESWDKGDGPLETCCILTTDANAVMAEIHDRMPVILDRAGMDRWLDPKEGREGLRGLLQPYPESCMTGYAVSRKVNSPANDGPELLEESEA